MYKLPFYTSANQIVKKRGKWQRISFFVAAILLVVFVGSLLGSNYFTLLHQKKMVLDRINTNLNGRVEAVSYFLDERQNDAAKVATGKIVGAYFSNKALGMSMAYGLKGSLNNVVNQFKHLTKTTLLKGKPIYKRVVLFDIDGNVLAETKSCTQCQFKKNNWKKIEQVSHMASGIVFDDNNPEHIMVVATVGKLGETVGFVVGWVNLNDIYEQFLCLQKHSSGYANLAMNFIALEVDEKIISPYPDIIDISSLHKRRIFNGSSGHVYRNSDSDEFSHKIHIPTGGFFVFEGDIAGKKEEFLVLRLMFPNRDISLIQFVKLSSIIDLKSPKNLLILMLIISFGVLAVVYFTIQRNIKNHVLIARLDEAAIKQQEIIKANESLRKEVEQRKETEKTLTDKRALLQSLFDSIPDLIFYKNIDSIYLGCNKTFEDFTGKTEKNIIGLSDYELFDSETAELFSEYGSKMFAITCRNEEWVVYPDGAKVLLDMLKTPYYSPDGEILGFIGIGRDITDRKKMEVELRNAKEGLSISNESLEKKVQERTQELQEAYSQLSMQEKMASIGQLSAGIAHEINTPAQFVGDNLRFIHKTFADMINIIKQVEKLQNISSQKEYQPIIKEILDTLNVIDIEYLIEETPLATEQALDGVKRISKIVKAMRVFSAGNEEKTSLDINEAIRSTLVVCKNEWKYNAKIVMELDENLPHVFCYSGEFNQVILNLIVNATYAVKERYPSGLGQITISTKKDENSAEIRIEDNGIGIPEKIRNRIFDPFFTTKKVGKGTGQGLHIAYSIIVEKHNGSITFESEEGVGTTFIVRLPLDPEK